MSARAHGPMRAWMFPQRTWWRRGHTFRLKKPANGALLRDLLRWVYIGARSETLPRALAAALSVSEADANSCIAPTLIEDMQQLMHEAASADVVLVSGAWEHRVHSVVLQAHARSWMGHERIAVAPVTLTARPLLIRLLYLGVLPADARISGADAASLVAALGDLGMTGAVPHVLAQAWCLGGAADEPAPVLQCLGRYPDPGLEELIVRMLASSPAVPSLIVTLPAAPQTRLANVLMAHAADDPGLFIVTLASVHDKLPDSELDRAMAQTFCAVFPKVVPSPVFKRLLQPRGEAPLLTLLLTIVLTYTTVTDAPELYQLLVGQILASDDGVLPTGAARDAVESARLAILRSLQQYWVMAQKAGAFDALAPWCLKELGSELDVDPAHLRLKAPPASDSAPAAGAAQPASSGASMRAMTSAGLGGGAPDDARGPSSMYASAVSRHAARSASGRS